MTPRRLAAVAVVLASCATVVAVLGLVLHWPLPAYGPVVYALALASVVTSVVTSLPWLRWRR